MQTWNVDDNVENRLHTVIFAEWIVSKSMMRLLITKEVPNFGTAE